MARIGLRIAALSVAVASCGGAATRVADAPTDPHDTGHAAIHLHDGIATVQARVNRIPMQFVVDTGANAHVLVGPAFVLAGGSLGRSIGGTDATGVMAGAVAEGIRLRIARHTAAPIIMLPEASPLTDARLAGVLTPLLWANDGVRIDLMDGRLTIGTTDDDDELASLVGHVGRCEGRSPTLVAIVDAEIGGVPARLLLDTGTSITTLYAESTSGQRVLATGGATTQAVHTATGDVDASRVESVAVRVGSRSAEIAVHVVDGRDQSCIADGLLGLDVLLGCVLDVYGSHLRAHCSDEPPRVRPLEPELTRIHVTRVEIAPSCGVDERALSAASQIAGGWSFPDWLDAAASLSSDAGIGAPASLVTRACAARQEPAPAYERHWVRDGEGLVLRYSPP